MKTIELTVEGMTCGSCVKHVKQALQAVPGVVHVEVDLLSGRARVQGDLQVGSTSLIAALAEEDYVANRGCTEFCVNGLMAGNRRTSWREDDRKSKESSPQRPHRQSTG